jgi:hypothetical protein
MMKACKTCGDMDCTTHLDSGGKVAMPSQASSAKSLPPPKPVENNELDNAGGWSGAMANAGKEISGMFKAKGGEIDMPDMDSSDDDELHDQIASELMDAFKSGDKKGMLEAIKAIVMSCGGKV